MFAIQWGPAIVSVILAFFVGGLWYSTKMFGNAWVAANGNAKVEKHHRAGVYIVSLIFYLLAALFFNYIVGIHPDFVHAVKMGLAVGVAFVAGSFAINYLFAGRSIKLLLIDGFYHVVQFLIYGIVFGLWK